MKTLFNVLLLAVLACCRSHQNREHDLVHDQYHDHNQDDGPDPVPPIIKTAWAEFRGGYNVTRLGRRFETYRGIRYAEPPVGELRFQPPKLILEYKNPVDASEDGPACPLPAPPGYYVDEDCLTVSVYTPLSKDRKEPLPVIVFIPAGGFYSVTRSDLAGPHHLLDTDIVLVTINYRLGSPGSTFDELAPGNVGFKDQVAALKWVQRNIEAFGGDPANVTIVDGSDGSFSVLLHMTSPMSKGLFRKDISTSGSPINIRSTRAVDQNVPPIIKTAWAEFRGGYNVTRLGRRFETYRGIRYAEPPVGELRFQPPKLILEYKSPVDASEDGPACPLPAPPGYYVDEDCLTVSVYTPLSKDRKEPLPVIVFIPAGGFYSVTRSDLAGPHNLLDTDIVLVTINYRLGSPGSTDDELAPGNVGFKDQVSALKWVQRNIAAFGGDPANVTIAGGSDGSFSVLLHMSKGLFRKGISMSGSPINIRPTRAADENGNINCANCVNCVNCVDCANCNNCQNCRNCADCRNCRDCQKCQNGVNCVNCVDCADCQDCRDCRNCANCKNCQECRYCQNDGYCQNCENCQNSENCVKCINCQNSHNCQNCQNCQDCKGCQNCDNCQDCQNCQNRQNCKNSVNCENCQIRQNVN